MRPRLSYANVTATLALIVAVGGASAFAATQLAKNSVGSKQLKKNAVTSAKVKNNSLTGSDINEATLGVVPNATNAQTLGGISASQLSDAAKLRCPSGTTLVVGVCFETERRPFTPLVVAETQGCPDDRRLPTEGEMIAFLRQTATALAQGEWVEPAYFDGENQRGTFVIYNPGGSGFVIGTDLSGSKHPYRCVTMPSN
jgi:hypothetical protein